MDPTQPMQLLSRSRAEEQDYVPALVRIPAGWFLMGCDTGQDNEKPVHRVWVDEFLLAARQVTNADYGRFLRDTASSSLPPPFWSDPAFNHPEQPVVGVSWYEAIRYCEWLSASTGGKFRLPTEAEWERAARGGKNDEAIRTRVRYSRGAMRLRSRCPATPIAALVIGRRAPNPSAAPSRTHTASTTCATTCTSGAATGTRPTTMRCRPSAIHAALKPASGALPAAAPGVTTSRYRAARPAPAFLRSSSTRTMGSASRAKWQPNASPEVV